MLADGGGEQGATLAQRLHVPRHLTALHGLHPVSLLDPQLFYPDVGSVLQANQGAVHDD